MFSSFKIKHYNQKEALASGSPLSPILVNISLDHLETSLLSKPKLNFVRCTRYVHDGRLIYNSDSELDFLLKGLNSFNSNLSSHVS